MRGTADCRRSFKFRPTADPVERNLTPERRGDTGRPLPGGPAPARGRDTRRAETGGHEMSAGIRRLLGILAVMSMTLALAPAAVAGTPVDPTTLNPVPPDFYSCQADGPNTICRGSFEETVVADD